ncbi:MAG TPA: CYTH and CHAD domain-containing protein [Actinocrinis sp.]|nr:CYTH and CHAD domain-containing protein [Actinocrinis sp.]
MRETEWKYEAAQGALLPDLTRVPHVAQVTEPDKQVLKATYHDTEDLRLMQAGITLRRRTGGNDEGWHLKLPDGHGARTELRLPLERDLPAELAGLVRAWTRGAAVGPVARITTKRQSRLLRDESGSTLAEVVLDDITAESLGRTTALTRWNEVEVELVEGDLHLLKSADKRLRHHGMVRSQRTAKLEHALADRLPAQTRTGAASAAHGVAAASSAGDVVLAYLRDQRDKLVRYDPRVRRDEPDAVHKMRVTTRRLRSALQAFRRLFDQDQDRVTRLGDELKWLGETLGQARDAEVLRGRLLTRLGQLPPELAAGPVQARITGHFAPREAEARAELIRALDGERYLALLDALDTLLDQPPLTPAASRPADKTLPKLVRKVVRRVDRRMGEAVATTPGPDRAVALHQARKAAKRARYAAEALAEVPGKHGKKASSTVKSMKKLQTVLGDHQDAVIASATVREMGMIAHMSGENGFTYGILHEREVGAMPQLQAEAERTWARKRR